MPILEVRNISFGYGLHTPFAVQAIDNVSFSIERGECVSVIGHTGSGKSTLMQMLNGLLKPDRGQVLLNGKDINETKKTAAAARFRVGLCFQYPEYQLFGETCAADIGFGPFDLSGGQKRRCAIAGVIAMEPEILILDEPTAGLDPVGREEILDMIRRCRAEQGATIMIVTHSMEIAASISDRILVLNKGKLHLSGTPQEVFADTQKLHEIGLDVPSYTRILRALRDKGFDLPDAYTLPDAAKLLCRLLKEGGRT